MVIFFFFCHDKSFDFRFSFLVIAVDKELEKLTRYQSVSSTDRRLIAAFREIAVMAHRIHLPMTIVHRAKYLYRQIYNINCLKGRSTDARASACLYIACRQEKCPRTFKEMCAISSVSKREIGRCFKLIIQSLATNVEMTNTHDFLSRFCGNLGLLIVLFFWPLMLTC